LQINRTNVLGVGVSSLNMKEAVETLLDTRANGQAGYVCVTGVHGVIESQRDPELKRIHNRSFLTVPDGMPIVWVGKEQGFKNMDRVYGPDLMLAVCEKTAAFNQKSEELNSDFRFPISAKKCFTHFLYGATEEVLEKLKANLEERFPGIQIVGTYAPPFRPLNEEEEEELRQIVADCRPDFFWVGLSTPKQEKFMASHSPAVTGAGSREQGAGERKADFRSPISDLCKFPLDAGIMLGVGAAFDFHAGNLKDAPSWVKNSGLQWFYRLCQEPRRLWRRYADIVPRFLFLSVLQMLGIKKYDMRQ